MKELVVEPIPNLLLDRVTFCQGLNVVVGEPCSGKSRFLYEMAWSLRGRVRDSCGPVFLAEDELFLHYVSKHVIRECENPADRLAERRPELVAEEMIKPLLTGQLLIGKPPKGKQLFASEFERYAHWNVQLNDESALPREILFWVASASQKRLLVFHRLLQNNSINRSSFLFWDCPETYLTTLQQKVVARTLGYLANIGTKVFLTTKSLFFLRELDILIRSEFKETPRNFMSVAWSRGKERGYKIRQGESVDDIGDIPMLQEELAQSDRYLDLEAEGDGSE